MSIQSEITRISGNISDSLAAVESKGVAVPSGANSDNLANLISLINTDGGSNIFWATYGTTTSAQIETAYQAGKICLCDYNNVIYRLIERSSSTSVVFGTSLQGSIVKCIYVNSDMWTSMTFNLAPLDSPALTGTPTAPTPSSGTDTTQIATTAFVQAALPSTAADVGAISVDNISNEFSTSTTYSKGDYVYYNGSIYHFTANHAAGTWTGSDAEIVKVADDLRDAIKNIDDIEAGSYIPISFEPNITKGKYYKTSDGSLTSATLNAATASLWNGYGYRTAVELTNSTYWFRAHFYDSTGTTSGTGYIDSTPYCKSGLLFIPPYATMFSLTFRRADAGTVSNTDVTAIAAALKAYRVTDQTLTQRNQPADAKAVGDALAEKAPAVTEVTVSTAGDVTQALDAGKIYHFTGALSSLTITLNTASGTIAQYHFDFDSGSTPPTVTLPNGVTMQGSTFTPEASKHYEVDILNGYGVSLAW